MRDAGTDGVTAEMRSTHSVAWTVGGAAFGVALLVAYALLLLNTGGAGWKVLVAVWLAAWPVLLAGGLGGHVLGRLTQRLRGTSP